VVPQEQTSPAIPRTLLDMIDHAGILPTVRAATRADVRELAKVLTRAFFDAPQFAYLLPDPALRARALPATLGAALRFLHPVDTGGEVVVVNGAILGGSAWMPPGRWRTSTWQQLRAAPALVRALGRQGLQEYGKRGQALTAAMHAAHPTEPHWYLAILGTDPDVQSRGVGSALMRSGLARCDREQADAYLECREEHVPYYARFGFEVTRPIPMPEGAPTQYGMWRQRRQTASERASVAGG
jgi:ribosomal protein S18 acetylase RimI-like enzyme